MKKKLGFGKWTFFFTPQRLTITPLFMDILSWNFYCNFFKYVLLKCHNMYYKINKHSFKKKSFFFNDRQTCPLNLFNFIIFFYQFWFFISRVLSHVARALLGGLATASPTVNWLVLIHYSNFEVTSRLYTKCNLLLIWFINYHVNSDILISNIFVILKTMRS